MSDRLEQLLRQKALLLEHLAWLDREIAAVAPAPAAKPEIAPAPRPAPASSADQLRSDAHAVADEIIARYQTEEALKPQDVKRGCLIAFFAVLGLCVTALVLIVIFGYSG